MCSYVCIHVYVCLCMYVYVDICIYVSMSLCIYVSMHPYFFVSMYLFIYASMCICIHISVLLCVYLSRHKQDPITNHAHQESNHKPIIKFVIGRRGVPNVDIEFFFFLRLPVASPCFQLCMYVTCEWPCR